MKVNVWEENILLPTYGIGQPEKNPMFLEKRVYQGSSGVVYPYPVIEKIEDTCEDKLYHAVYLENEYIKVMILPELGGRVQMAYDKIKQRHFIYYNHVIKPALVGLTGPWISGGIEFNWPQHHRPSTFLPVDFAIEEKEDGSATVWVNEQERMFRQKGTAGFTLRPGRAVLEVQGKVYNPTPLPQTFLWWANPAVAVNEHYQSVFPGDVSAVFDHGKRDVSAYPIATGTYYKIDYSEGVDISRYKNIPVPTSYMAIRSEYDFVGGYENDTQAGVLHVANHHISPGKKQWTWGNGDFGQAWIRNLTDNDGPYIELMAGVYTDNQPDFSWLQPYEEKSFTQYFIPYRELGVVKNASADILMNIEKEKEQYVLKVLSTSVYSHIRIVVKKKKSICLDTITNLSPEYIFTVPIDLPDLEEAEISISKKSGTLLLFWAAEKNKKQEVPQPAKAVLLPQEVATTEELYLTGLHLEQYRHATYNPVAYYQEALRRDHSDIRNNNAMGLWLMRKGQFEKAEKYFRKAIETLTEKNPNPYDGEPFYNLGVTLKYQKKNEEAYRYFYKSCWNAAWQDAGYYALAQLSVIKKDWQNALDEIDKSLARNWYNHRGRHLKAIVLRKKGDKKEANELIDDSLKIDPFNFGCLFEKYLLSNEDTDLERLVTCMRQESHNYEELMLDYASAGCWEEALTMADIAITHVINASPLIYYYKCWFLKEAGYTEEAVLALRQAELQPSAYCFPNRLDDILVLQSAISLSVETPKAFYYLGNLWYDKRQYPEAMDCWEHAISLDPAFPTSMRNLSLAYFNKMNKKEEAVNLLEKAFFLDTTDARILMELDQLYKRLNCPHRERLAFLEKFKETVLLRDDLYLEYITLFNQLGEYEKAVRLLNARMFHPWEGGEGKVTAQYQLAYLELAKRYISWREFDKALHAVDRCFIYPSNLGEGKLYNAQENDFLYYKACILEELGRKEEAIDLYGKAGLGNMEPIAALYYNDQKPDKIFYQGLALKKLGKIKESNTQFKKLLTYGKEHVNEEFKMDYFAVSLPDLQIWEDDLTLKHRLHCYYLLGLGYMGLEDYRQAKIYLEKAALIDMNHQGVQIHRAMIDNKIKTIIPEKSNV